MLSVIILAAGKGTRMKSPRPKVLHPLGGEPLIVHVLEAALGLRPQNVLVVVGHRAKEVERALKGYAVEFVLQREQLGTGHAVMVAASRLPASAREVMVLCGDVPLIRPETLARLLELHRKSGAVVTLLTAEVPEPKGYGRVVRAEDGSVLKIVEEKDANPKERKISEINAGTYVFEKDFLLEALKELRPENAQGEYYLTDVVYLAQRRGLRISALKAPAEEVLGVNSQFDLARVEGILQRRLREKFMSEGVTLISPETIYLERRVSLAPGVIIYPFVSLRGETRLGEGTVVESFCDLKDVETAPGVRIRAGRILKRVFIAPESAREV